MHGCVTRQWVCGMGSRSYRDSERKEREREVKKSVSCVRALLHGGLGTWLGMKGKVPFG